MTTELQRNMFIPETFLQKKLWDSIINGSNSGRGEMGAERSGTRVEDVGGIFFFEELGK
jgi:hypothetical protein